MSESSKPWREFWIDSVLNIDRPETKTAYIYEQDCEKIRGNEVHVIEYAALAEAQAEIARLKEKFADYRAMAGADAEEIHKLTTELNQAKAELLLLKTKQELEALANTKEVYRGEKIVQENAKLEAQVAELKGALENEQEYLRVLNEGCLKALKNDLWTLMADERINSIENTLKKLKPDQKE